jgi:hypothetical protein
LAHLRGLLGKEHQKQGIRSALRQEIVLQALDVELAGKEMVDHVLFQGTVAILNSPILQLSSQNVAKLNEDFTAQIRKAHEMLGAGIVSSGNQLSAKGMSVDAMFAIYQAMIDARVIKKPPA